MHDIKNNHRSSSTTNRIYINQMLFFFYFFFYLYGFNEIYAHTILVPRGFYNSAGNIYSIRLTTPFIRDKYRKNTVENKHV